MVKENIFFNLFLRAEAWIYSIELKIIKEFHWMNLSFFSYQIDQKSMISVVTHNNHYNGAK